MLVLTFQVGKERLALDTRRIEAVVPRVPLRSVAGGPPWLSGVFVYHGAIVPVVDLHRLVGAGDCPPHLSSRIVLVADPAPSPLPLSPAAEERGKSTPLSPAAEERGKSTPLSPVAGERGRGEGAAGEGRLVGLLAAQVDNLQDVKASATIGFAAPGMPDLGPVIAEGTSVLRLLDLGRLLPDSGGQLVAAMQEPLA